MQIHPINLKNQSSLIEDYRNKQQKIMSFFDYEVSGHEMKQRLDDVKKYQFKRSELVTGLTQLNKKWDAPQSTLNNIQHLDDSDSVVVVGGQQAGLLTGPMYTINKIISIIQYAKQQEEALNVPVIPVFWIAGEDHDFDEINHIFVPEQQEMKKVKTSQGNFKKRPISDIPLDKEKTNQWIDEVFRMLQETEFTKETLSWVRMCLGKSTTFVDFFARCLFQIFDEHGLVLFDSGNKEMRQLESRYFIKQIEKQEQISEGVHENHRALNRCCYQIDLDTDRYNTHLFYHVNHERVLLFRTKDGHWIGKNMEVKLTTEQLKKIATDTPQLLSNNVVSRPLMQEMLFPTLAFIAGPGEVSYWSTLKPAFHALGLKVPPVVPRLSMTYVDDSIMKLMDKYLLEFSDCVNNGLVERREDWLSSQISPPVNETVTHIKNTINQVHEPLRKIAYDLGADMGSMAQKNVSYLYRDLDYLQNRLVHSIQEKYRQEILEFNRLDNCLHPQQGLQERSWNPFILMNQFGKAFMTSLVHQPLSFEEDHFLVVL